mgnify:CR=1 FL=1
MIGKIQTHLHQRRDKKQRHKRAGDAALHASRERYPDDETIWEPRVLEDQDGIVVGLFYRGTIKPPLRRFWSIDSDGAREADGSAVAERFDLGPYR